MATIRDFMDQRQLTVYNKGDSHMKTEKSPVGELMFVPLNRKKVALAVPAKCLTAEHKYRLRMIEAAAAAGHYARPAVSNYQHKIWLRQRFFSPVKSRILLQHLTGQYTQRIQRDRHQIRRWTESTAEEKLNATACTQKIQLLNAYTPK